MLNQTNYKNLVPDIEQELLDLLTSVQSMTYSSISSSQLQKFASSLPTMGIIQSNIIDDSIEDLENFDAGGLQQRDCMFSSQAINELNQIWSRPAKVNSRQKLFARNFHNQRRCILSLKRQTQSKNKAIANQIGYYSKFTLPCSNGQREVITFNQDDIESVKKGFITFPILLNYASILRASSVIPMKSYIFPLNFMEKLIGFSMETQQKAEKQVLANIQKNIIELRRQLNINIFDYEYLIIPMIIEKGYKCIIVQGISSFSKINIIFCNFRPNTSSIFSNAIRLYLFNQGQSKGIKLSSTSRQMPAIHLMLPRQFNHIDSGIYVMLYLEFLFAKKASELQKIRMIQNHKKLHLFPRSLALSSRQQIWNLFISLQSEDNEKKRTQICLNFLQKRSRFCYGAVGELDYDRIEGRQLQKFMILNEIKHKKYEPAVEYENQLNYYLDPDLNYYLSQSVE